jgi:hypothetical protein
MKRIYRSTDIVTGLLNPPAKIVTYDNKDYFLNDIISVFKGTDAGKQVIEKINTNLGKVTDPILDKTLDKAYNKVEGDLKIGFVLLSLIVVTNLIIIYNTLR